MQPRSAGGEEAEKEAANCKLRVYDVCDRVAVVQLTATQCCASERDRGRGQIGASERSRRT
jgi:hypothetical protein